VTGGSGGIGASIATKLAQHGLSVAVGYGKNGVRAQSLVNEITARSGRAVAIGADLRFPDASSKLVDAVEANLGSVDVLVSNAEMGKAKPLEHLTVDDFDETIAVNLRAPFLLAQRTIPGMKNRRFGRILFISSVAGFTGGLIGPHYAASKAGLHGLTHFLAQQTAAFGVTVNALAPALITETGMIPGDSEELRQRIPVGRLGRPEEVADLALAILRNPYLTNQVISLDGGMHPR